MSANLRPAKRQIDTGRPVRAAVAERPAGPKPVRRKGERLSLADRYTILELHKQNPELTYNDLARLTGFKHYTVRFTILAAERSAIDLMASYAEPMLQQWIGASTAAAARGDHRPSKEWLMHAGIIEPLPDATKNTGSTIVVVNAGGMPGMPVSDILTPAPEIRDQMFSVRTVGSAVTSAVTSPHPPLEHPQNVSAPDALPPSDLADLEPDD